ncbi:MAG: pyridoxamine 5'-phosphate oxidase [Segniliparus sp.]|uniref:pyridoxamine 5'-phosphate oxidase n=1 Tax=Segniliparus sp. TaxID=2804064 RepID=UPI003F3FCBE1
MTADPTAGPPALPDLREEYQDATPDLDVADVQVGWHVLLEQWLAQAWAAGLPDANAMVLATADREGRPHSRSVLCKGIHPDGIDFYTHYASAKGAQLAEQPLASATFPWYGLSRQVHLRGEVSRLDHEFSDGYWSRRPRSSQLGAWASEQSRPIGSREELEAKLRAAAERFPEDEPVPLPSGWGGYRLVPSEVEFWQGRASRLHNRVLLTRDGAQWRATRLQP